jgi:hypothetical protein
LPAERVARRGGDAARSTMAVVAEMMSLGIVKTEDYRVNVRTSEERRAGREGDVLEVVHARRAAPNR